MNIAFILTQSLDSPSGLGRYGPIARQLAQRGHKIEIYALHHDWSRIEKKVYGDRGIQVNYVGQMHILKRDSQKHYFKSGKLIYISLLATLRLALSVWQSQAELLQLCKPQPINSLAARLARRGRQIFCDCDDYEAKTNVFSNLWQQSITRYFEDSIIYYATGLTVNTHFNRERYCSLGFPREKIIYVPNGVERSRFKREIHGNDIRRRLGIEPQAPLIVYIGTLGLKSHPVDLLLEAFKIVLQDLPEARLLLVGGGEDLINIIKLSGNLGIRGNTIFKGNTPSDEIPDYLAAATVTVDPVKNDLIAIARNPLKIVESLAMGVPVVTGDVGDRNILLKQGELGVLVKPGDSKALAEGLLYILYNTEIYNNMSHAALDERESWYWDKLVDEFIKVYQFAR